jgi:hypothetical protein
MAETVKLYLLQEYISRSVHYKAGETIEIDRETALFLQRDAPGCFAPVEWLNARKAVEAPPVDKMVKKPAKKK